MSTVWGSLKGFLQRALDMLGDEGDERPAPRTPADFERIYHELNAAELHADSGELTDADLFADLMEPRRDSEFLGYYSAEGGLTALRRYGFVQMLEAKGIDPVFDVDTCDAACHRLQIFDGEKTDEHLVIELRAGFRDLDLPSGVTCRMLFIDWLLMQDPRLEFDPDRPRLPEQKHPGLGLFMYFGQLLQLMGTRLECDGLMNHPAHFHNAFLYGKAMDFADPADEGWFQALRRDLSELSLADATSAVDGGRVRDQHGEVVRWRGKPQVAPITLRLQAWLDSAAYKDEVTRVADQWDFTVDG